MMCAYILAVFNVCTSLFFRRALAELSTDHAHLRLQSRSLRQANGLLFRCATCPYTACEACLGEHVGVRFLDISPAMAARGYCAKNTCAGWESSEGWHYPT